MSTPAHTSHATRGMLLVAIGATLWSTTGIVSRILFEQTDVSPLTVAFIRFVIASPLFVLIGLLYQGSEFIKLPAGNRRWLIGLGLAQTGFQVGYLASVKMIGAGLATLITLCLAPVLVALLAATLLREPLTRRVLTAMLIAITGTALLVISPQALQLGSGLWTGISLALAAAAFYAGFTLIGRHAAGRVHPMQSAAFGFGVGAVVMLPLALWAGFAPVLAGAAIAVPALLYISLIPTTLGYVFFFNGLRHTTATVSSILVLLEPLGAALLAWLILDEALGTYGLLGAILLTGSVALLTLPRAAHQPDG
ncbi:DMT family transporter [Spiribacter onubensis]|uniref:DMT family transporter n=1 Tax=Spiribacter onubensis TaxID=3122420 RepID=A0ABV3S7J4_9GAMM